MRFDKAYIPYGAYWSTPFCRWQGSLAHRHSVQFAAEVAGAALKARGLDPKALDGLALGLTVPQKSSFYGGPWLTALIGAGAVTGPVISQACATGARTLANAALEVECGGRNAVLAVACDRTSNGMHVYYPNPGGPGGKGDAEDWVWDNFSHDPFAKNSMLDTAERLAKEAGYKREEQDSLALLRYKQYADALANDSAFLKRYMTLPFEVKDAWGKKVVATLTGDEGVPPTTAEGLAKLRPALEGGSVTPGTQTRPADGNCGALVVSQGRAKEWGRGPFEVKLLSYAEARTAPGTMPRAPAPAAKAALADAGVALKDVAAIKLHNPFAVGDLHFCRDLGVAPEKVNNFGSPLVWGHPQGPTGMRLVIELVEELALKGGGFGLMSGCAAGDSAAAIVVSVKGA